jgi:uncharacterized protein DUF4124
MRPSFALALGLWAVATAASAQVYRWVDPDGSIHYSDNPASAPKNAKVEITTGDDITVEGSGRIEAGTPPGNKPVPATPAAPAVMDWSDGSDNGTDELTVRQYFRSTHEKIAEAERLVAEQRKAVEQANAAHTAGCRGTREECFAWGEQQRTYREDARKRLAQYEADLRRWKSYLDDLERWASSKSVPRAWRQ